MSIKDHFRTDFDLNKTNVRDYRHLHVNMDEGSLQEHCPRMRGQQRRPTYSTTILKKVQP